MVFCLPQCFMNSILQCLSNTKELRDYCLQNQYLRDLNNNSRMRTALMSGIRGGREGGQDGDSCGVHPSPPPLPISLSFLSARRVCKADPAALDLIPQ